MNDQHREEKFRASASTYVNTGIAIVFILSAVFLLFVIQNRSQHQVLREAESKAQLILQRNLAIHTYFSQNLKPKVFELTDPIKPEGYFEPTWMSSTFAVREIDNYFRLMANNGDYYYKECVINARSPENEADEIERAFIEELNDDPQLQKSESVRLINGKHYYVAMYRGEVMGKSCLRCHSTPQHAPKDIVDKYGSSRSFNRVTDEVVSAVSIRIPLAEAYRETPLLTNELTWILLAVLLCLFAVHYIVNKLFIIRPLRILRDNVLALVDNEGNLGREISLPSSREMHEVAKTFNVLSKKMRFQIDNLEEMVEDRTSELKKTVLEFAKSEERYRLLIENALEGICVVQDGAIKFHTLRVQEMSGYCVDELALMPFIDLVHPDDLYDVVDRNARRLAGEDFSPLSHFRFIDKSGDVKWLEANTVVIDWYGAPATLIFMYDITDRKRMEDRIFLSEKMATIAGLAAGVAHEINTPLSAILQSNRVIQNALDEDSSCNQQSAEKCGVDLAKMSQSFKENELDFFIDGIRSSALNALRIINGLLEFSRPKMGDMKKVSINELLDKSLELSRSDYDLKKRYDIINIAVSKEYASDLPLVMCVPMEIEQVVLNLVKNAVHATVDDEKGKTRCITLRTILKGETVRIEIEDNGPGIKEEIRQKIFDPFYTTKEVGVGTGLGLSVSYAIIHEKHKGAIWVESEEGRGAKFVIELPVDNKNDK